VSDRPQSPDDPSHALAEARFESMLHITPTPTVITRLRDQQYVAVSDSFLALLGYDRAEVIGRTSTELHVWVDPLDRDRLTAALSLGGPVRNLEARVRTRAGDQLIVLVSAERMDFYGEPCVFTLANDITALRRGEEDRRHARRMEAIGQFAGGIAHDFNNMLQVISGFATVARHRLPDDHEVHAEVEQILRAASRAGQLTRQLLSFSRRPLSQARVIDLNALVGDMHRMLSRVIGEQVRLELRLDPSALRVRCDPGQLEQVLLNLCVNARDAMPVGGVLTLTVSAAPLDPEAASLHPELAGGGHVQLRVTDTGVGMDAATVERAFDPFFSTKATGQGTGLGLATVYGIVRQCGGAVWIGSSPGHGTTVHICLPGTEASADLAPLPPAQALREGRGETVLVVEDEPMVRRLAVQLLERHGYNVMEAVDGDDGLRVYEGAAGSIALVLTDVVMPGINGVEMVRRIAAQHPAARALFMTAWSGDAIPGSMQRYAAVLDKPFTPDALLTAVRAALDRP